MNWRFRFSLRTVAIVMTVVCIIIGGWVGARNAAQNMGARPPFENDVIIPLKASALLPFVIVREEFDIDLEFTVWGDDGSARGWKGINHDRYYLWLFGVTLKLPFESTIPPPPGANVWTKIWSTPG